MGDSYAVYRDALIFFKSALIFQKTLYLQPEWSEIDRGERA